MNPCAFPCISTNPKWGDTIVSKIYVMVYEAYIEGYTRTSIVSFNQQLQTQISDDIGIMDSQVMLHNVYSKFCCENCS